MAGRISLLRSAVPIALESASGDTEEGREFFQSRLALFGGWVTLIAGGFLVVSTALNFFRVPHVDPALIRIGNPDFYHAGMIVIGAALWALARRAGPLPMSTLEGLEAAAAILICTLATFMSVGWVQAHIAIGQDAMHGVLGGILGCSYVLLSRAIAVPSTPTRTLIVSALCMVPMAVFAAWIQATGPLPGTEATAFSDILTWSVAAIAMAVVASRVIFGLRAQIDKTKRLGQYTLEGKLGEGGMGVVYRASHAMLRRPTAIKLLKPEMAGAETIKRFEREVMLTASLSHPSTIAIFDYGRTPNGLFYYAMEYLDGLNLEQLVRAHGPQPAARVVHILRQVSGALAEAHGVGLIHRDVKPANIILSERGGMPDVAKVVDFGLVKSFDQSAPAVDPELTSVNLIVGTPLYMSPEAIKANVALDGRSDIYSLGAVAYYLLTGTPVFSSDSHIEIFSDHLHKRPEAPSARCGRDIPDDLERIVLKCLAKNPDDRYPSARALQKALRECTMNASWDNERAITWWARFHSGRPDRDAEPAADEAEPQTIAVDLGQRVNA